MPDNSLQQANENIATDELLTLNGVDVSGANPRIKVQRAKVTFGSDGDSRDVDGSNGLPVAALSAPATADTTDSIAVALQTGAIKSGLTTLTPKFAAIVASASGATAIVAAVASKKIRVLSLRYSVNAAVNVKWQSAANDKTGLMYHGGQGHGDDAGFSPVGHFETNVNEALNINLSGAVAVGGSLVYVEV